MKTLPVIILLGLSLSACVSNPNTAALTTLGGVGGGVACSQIGQGNGRIAAAVGCALLGALTGNHIGSKFDGVSHNQAAINQLRIQQQQQSRTGATTQIVPMVHPYAFGGASHSHSHNLGMNCSVRNNYVVCNGAH